MSKLVYGAIYTKGSSGRTRVKYFVAVQRSGTPVERPESAMPVKQERPTGAVKPTLRVEWGGFGMEKRWGGVGRLGLEGGRIGGGCTNWWWWIQCW